MSLPVTGELSYNGYTFPTETKVIGVSVQPVESQDGRANAANRYMLRIKSMVLAATGTDNDSSLDNIRERLTAYGGKLVYSNKGFGSFNINTNGRTGDVMWGPKPRELFWRPIGDSIAAEIIWQVEVVISDCTDSPYGRPMEFAWEVDVQQGKNRLTNRIISGYIKIPMRKSNVDSKIVYDSADDYYNDCVPVIPFGFRRENEKRHLSLDKARLDFSFTDVQLEAPLPFGCIEFDCEHSTSNMTPMLFTKWQGNISARYKMALYVNPRLSYTHFMDLIFDKLASIKLAQAVQPGQLVVPMTFSMTERPQTREYSYSFNYWHTAPIISIMLASMWRPVPSGRPGQRNLPANHQIWAMSVAHAMQPRGYTQDAFTGDDDLIVDLCDNNAIPLPRPPKKEGGSTMRGIPPPFEVECPSPPNSWLDYQCRVEILVDEEIVDHRPMPRFKLADPDPLGPGVTLGEKWSATTDRQGWLGRLFAWAAGQKIDSALFQRRNTPRVTVRLVGYAIRACYDISPPKLESIGGSPVVPANRPGIEMFTTERIGNCGVPIIAAKWVQRWVVAGRIHTIKTLPPPSPVVPNKDSLMKQVEIDDDGNPIFGGR